MDQGVKNILNRFKTDIAEESLVAERKGTWLRSKEGNCGKGVARGGTRPPPDGGKSYGRGGCMG
jgi:hypothetical protein